MSMYFFLSPRPSTTTLFPYTTLFRSAPGATRTLKTRLPASRRRTGATSTSRASPISRGSPTYRRRRSEEHTSELQSHSDLVCRLLLEKKNQHTEARHLYQSCRPFSLF